MSYRPEDASPLPRPQNLGRLARFQYLILAAAIAVFLTLGWRGRTPVRIIGGDELTYVSVSRSLENGSYRENHIRSAPLHVRYPPGYPAWLALLRKVGGPSFDLVRGANLLLAAVSILCLFLIVRRITSVEIALAAAGVLSLNHTLLEVGGTLLSEAPYLALTTASVACTVLATPPTRRMAWLAMALALAAFLTRSAGLALVIAIMMWLWSQRRIRELLAYGATCLLVVGGWFAYTVAAPRAESGLSYRADIVGGLRGTTSELPLRLASRFLHNVVGYLTEGLPWSMGLPTIPGIAVDNLLWLVASVTFMTVATVILWRLYRGMGAYMVLSAGLILLWPWRVDRLLIPLVPFALAAFLIGAGRLTRSIPSAVGRVALGTLIALMGFGALRGALKRDALMGGCDRAHPYDSPGCYDADSRGLAAASQYLRTHAAPDAVVVTLSGAGVNHLSGLITEEAGFIDRFPLGALGPALQQQGIRYVLINERGSSSRRERFGRGLLASCRDLRVEARFEADAVLLATEPPRNPSEESCALLAKYTAQQQ